MSEMGFRLLALSSAMPSISQSTPLRCSISHHDLKEQCPPYTALFYTWKQSESNRLVIADKRVPIDPSIHSVFDIRHEMLCGDKILLISTNLRPYGRWMVPNFISRLTPSVLTKAILLNVLYKSRS